jgi:galactan endo-1,6-beta-galactosidase
MIAASPARADYATTVNPSTNWGTWQGWGSSLAWWANQFGTNTGMADALYTLNGSISFTSNTGTYSLPGLGFNIVRYNVGGTSTSPITVGGTTYTPNNPSSNPAFKMIQNYWLNWSSTDPTSSSWDWTRDANQRNMMQLAKARGANIFQMFSDTPPWWMCYNSSTAGSNGGGDNLQSWNYDNFAIYLATVAQYAKNNWGITFESVEPFNEPVSTWWTYPCTQEGCHFDVSTQNAVIPYLRTELNNRGLSSMPIATSDANTYDEAVSIWNGLNSTSQSDCAQIDTHGYEYGSGNRSGVYSAAQGAGKTLWQSEYGESDATGMSLATNLNLDMRSLHPTAWCYWQPFDSGGWGMVQANAGDNWVGPANPKWFVMAQYSRHIRPGMKMIDAGEPNTVAAYDPVAHKLVLVTTNGATAQWVNYNLSNFAVVGGPVTRWQTNTGGGDMYVQHNDTGVSSKSVWSYFAANTVQTFEIQNVYITGSGLANGTYTLAPQNATGSRLDAYAWGTANGSTVDIWTSAGSGNQKWIFTQQTNGFFKIQPSYATGLCLDVSNGGSTDGTKVDLWADNNGGTNQLWNVIPVSGNIYKLSPLCAPGKTLDVPAAGTANGTGVDIWTDYGLSQEQWSIGTN